MVGWWWDWYCKIKMKAWSSTCQSTVFTITASALNSCTSHTFPSLVRISRCYSTQSPMKCSVYNQLQFSETHWRLSDSRSSCLEFAEWVQFYTAECNSCSLTKIKLHTLLQALKPDSPLPLLTHMHQYSIPSLLCHKTHNSSSPKHECLPSLCQ